MKINQPAPTKFSAYESRPGSAQSSAAYKIGQLLDAIVLSSSHGQIGLRIGTSEVIASSHIALQQNTHLSLKVIQLKPQLVLQVLPNADNNPLQQAMKNMLPRQTSLAPLLAELIHKTQPRNASSNPSPHRTAGNLLVAAIPERNDIKQAEGLQRAIMQSGLFLEANLARQGTNGSFILATDLKALLLRYLDALKKTHKDDTSAKHTRIQTGADLPGTKVTPPLSNRVPADHTRLPYSTASLLQTATSDNIALFKKLQNTQLRPPFLQTPASRFTADSQMPAGTYKPAPPGLAGGAPASQTRALHTPLAAGQQIDSINSALLNRLQTALNRLDPLHAARTMTAEQAQSGTPRLNSDIPPPLKGHLPIHHPRIMHNEVQAIRDLSLNLPAILKKIEGPLARLGLLQVATVENFNDGQHLWQLEIPVRHGKAIEMISLTIEKEQKKSSEEDTTEDNWCINLSLDLPRLGPLQSRINMDKSGLSATFWSELPATLAIIENRLAELRTRLEQRGLETHTLSCRAGQQQGNQTSQPDGAIIDYRI